MIRTLEPSLYVATLTRILPLSVIDFDLKNRACPHPHYNLIVAKTDTLHVAFRGHYCLVRV